MHVRGRCWLAWGAWASLLWGVPEVFPSPSTGSVNTLSLSFSYGHAVMALAFIAGIALAARTANLRNARRPLVCLMVAGVLSSIVLVALSWLAAGVLLHNPESTAGDSGFASALFACALHLEASDYLIPLIAFSSFSCAASLCLCFVPGETLSETPVLEGKAENRLHLAICMASLLFGFLRAYAMAGFSPAIDTSSIAHEMVEPRPYGTYDFALLAIPSLLAYLWLLPLSGFRGRERLVLYLSLLPLGELASRFVGRCAPGLVPVLVSMWPMLVAVQCLCVAVPSVGFWLMHRLYAEASSSDDSHEGDVGCGVSVDMPSTCEKLASLGLTKREAEVTSLQFERLTSQQIGERLNLSSSTVRSYQRRVYQKLGVSDAEGLKAFLGELGGNDSTGDVSIDDVATHDSYKDENAPRGVRWVWMAGLAAGLVLVLPVFVGGSGRTVSWEDGWLVPLALGAGLVLWCVSVVILETMPLGSASSGALLPSRVLMRILCIASGVTFLGYRLALSFGSLSARPLSSAGSLSLSLLVFLFLWDVRIRGWRRCVPNSARPFDVVGAGEFWEGPTILVALLFGGMSYAVTWRSLVEPDVTLVLAFMPLCVSVCIVNSLIIVQRLEHGRQMLLELALLAAACAPPSNMWVAIELFLMGSWVLCLFALWCSGILDLRVAKALAASFGLGSILGVLFASQYFDTTWVLSLSRVVGPLLRYEWMVAYVLGAILLALSFAYFLACRSLGEDLDARQSYQELAQMPDRRIRGYLESRGLNDTQVSVMMLVAQGNDRTRIARQLGYSVGTVNSAKAAGYRLLGVHSRAGLSVLLAAVLAE